MLSAILSKPFPNISEDIKPTKIKPKNSSAKSCYGPLGISEQSEEWNCRLVCWRCWRAHSDG